MTETVGQLLEDFTQTLESVSDSPQLDCRILLGHVLQKSREWLYAHDDDQVTDEQNVCYQKLIERRQSGEPVAYVTGSRSFWDREFSVTPATLIPRPETELLIETILERLEETPCRVLDLGTGSGAIAVSLAAERPNWQITGIDCSADALEIARNNGEDLPNLNWCCASWCDHIPQESIDLIVSNPPYVAAEDPHLEQLAFEPRSALAAGPDGLDCIREIVPAGYHCLKGGGLLVIEHGHDQQDAVMAFFNEAGFTDIEGLTDLQGNPRAVLGVKPTL